MCEVGGVLAAQLCSDSVVLLELKQTYHVKCLINEEGFSSAVVVGVQYL